MSICNNRIHCDGVQRSEGSPIGREERIYQQLGMRYSFALRRISVGGKLIRCPHPPSSDHHITLPSF
uniref:Uncharacterized protein n=1 Tax=Kalanchoe fedtschenkoi TaxID=63787 RepID=A0A7N0T2T9_KALFE